MAPAHRWSWILKVAVFCLWLSAAGLTEGEPLRVTGRVEVLGSSRKAADLSNVVVWLSPVRGSAERPASIFPASSRPRLVQRNKHFDPHLLVIPVGTSVEFPNRDPFFHNVFSLFEGKRFDLGLYEAGTTRYVAFDKPGISYIFCNIHAEMSAVVIALDTPYYAISNARGELSLADVPAGRYQVHVWSEDSLPDDLKSLAREITVSDSSTSLGVVRINQNQLAHVHKNKYGRDYERPTPANPAYEQ
jgi:plastocyanin